jgi:elongation factor Ts
MQVAAMNPRYISEDQVPEKDWAAVESEYGSRKKAVEALCLYQQPFIRDPKVTILDLIRDGVAKLGENIVVQRFARFEVGADRQADTSSD